MNNEEQLQILVVDDTPQNLKLLSDILSNNNYKVRPANSGQLALRSVALEPPSLILLDIRMPDMDGYEVCRLIKENESNKNIPIIFISAMDEVEDKVKGFEAGGVDYIVKPFQPAEVLARVRTHLELWQLQKKVAIQNMQLQKEILIRKQVEAALREINEQIETQVQERTEELKDANIHLAEKEARVQGILNAIPDLLFVLDKKGVFLGYVAKTEEQLYSPPEQFLNRTVYDILPESLAKLTMSYIVNALETQKTQIYEYDIQLDGETHYFEAHMAPSNNEQVVCIIRDITERKNAEEIVKKINDELEIKVQERTAELKTTNENLLKINEELETAYSELTKAQQQILQQEKMASIGQLAAGVAHEINNPLGVIISNLASLQNYTNKYVGLYSIVNSKKIVENVFDSLLKEVDFDFINNDMKDIYRETSEGLKRICKIVNSLRRFSRIDSYSNYEIFEKYNLNEEIKNVLEICNTELKYVTEIICDFGDIPELYGHSGEISQVIFNLLMNAGSTIKKKYPSGLGIIKIRTWFENCAVNLLVCDNGEGIDKDQLNKIFDPFYTTKPVGAGMGLGLSTSYDIVVHKHLGNISVKSELGHGSEFFISLPVNTPAKQTIQ